MGSQMNSISPVSSISLKCDGLIVKGQGHQVKYLGEGICHALPLFSLDLESMIRNNVKIHSNLHDPLKDVDSRVFTRWDGRTVALLYPFTTLLRGDKKQFK
jgi:hypothetical protein